MVVVVVVVGAFVVVVVVIVVGALVVVIVVDGNFVVVGAFVVVVFVPVVSSLQQHIDVVQDLFSSHDFLHQLSIPVLPPHTLSLFTQQIFLCPVGGIRQEPSGSSVVIGDIVVAGVVVAVVFVVIGTVFFSSQQHKLGQHSGLVSQLALQYRLISSNCANKSSGLPRQFLRLP